MTNEEKQLLLNDLCGRLPYGVKVNYKGLIRPLFSVSPTQHYQITLDNAIDGEHNGLEFVSLDVDSAGLKPYLRPLSSMTDGEESEYEHLRFSHDEDGWLDFVYSRHLDWRNLIPMKLALEAPEDMYKTK